MNNQIIISFITGLTTGGLSCVAVQGGLLASVLSSPAEELQQELTPKSKSLPLVTFLSSKVLAHTVLGFFLGFVGSVITLTPQLRGWLQIGIALYLLGIGLSLINAHPIFRYFVFTPPKFLARILRDQSKSNSIFAPAILGALTVFIPCATTQAMEVVALGAASPLISAAIMAAFTLGTTPTFYLLGLLYAKLSEKFHQSFYRVAFAVMVIMSIYTFNNGMALLGSIYTIQNFVEVATSNGRVAGVTAANVGGSQEVSIDVFSSGYSPNNITLKSGVKTRLLLKTSNTSGCARSFTIPSLKLSKLLPESGTETLEFTPVKKGPLVFSCSMGMYTGQFNVI